MRRSWRRPGMTIHRRSFNRRGREEGEPGAVLTAVQTAFCLMVLLSVFTMQFVSGERFEQLGIYFQAVMGQPEAAQTAVGILGEPITPERIQEYLKQLEEWTELEELPLTPLTGMGGENPWIPENVVTGPVVTTAAARYPAYGTVTSFFGLREHPISGAADFHTGLDIAAPMGSSIYAVFPGEVAEVGVSDIYGNYIRLTHSGGLETVYCHCSEILAPEGAVVRAGERIAEVGSTGISTGPHVHLSVLLDGSYLDPLELFRW
ncbi:M23 family metallopeptidase [Angelakisella massiliensis]|uniref:M23 family metallopeptidase n=1 Tax=Angelakisella massiliensis TaxID=1871018 RepID=UPI0023A83923|nr:M23 family metallopeptidase [Angelakisella massiliensis]